MAIIIPSKSIYAPITYDIQKRNKTHIVKYNITNTFYESGDEPSITLKFFDVILHESSGNNRIKWACKVGENSNYYLTEITQISTGGDTPSTPGDAPPPGYSGYMAKGYTILETDKRTDFKFNSTISEVYTANKNIGILAEYYSRSNDASDTGSTNTIDRNRGTYDRRYFAITNTEIIDDKHIKIYFTVNTLLSDTLSESGGYGGATVGVTFYLPNAVFYFLREEQEQLSITDNSGTETFDMPTNELCQDINLVDAESMVVDGELYPSENTPISTVNANMVLNKYRNGKENINLKCSLVDYYDEYGNLAISINYGMSKSMFDIGDYVIPMKSTPSGDMPMSVDSNNNAKIFVVLGVEFIFDGAIWQELVLQEKS